MAKDPEEHSEYEDRADAVVDDGIDDGAEEEYEPVVPDRPTCPRCGWHNTRPSHSKNLLDTILLAFSLRPYRCRSCAKRFRVRRTART
jgi:hypothetical protein